MKWLGIEVTEQLDTIQKATKRGVREFTSYSGNIPKGSEKEVYGIEFEEYVNEVWVDFLDKFEISEKYKDDSDLSEEELYVEPLINKFIEYLERRYQPSFNSNIKSIQASIQAFQADTFNEWDDLVEKYADLTDEEFDKLTDDLLAKKLDEFHRKMEGYKNVYYEPYIPLDAILKRLSQNQVAKRGRIVKKERKNISIDDETQKLIGQLREQSGNPEESYYINELIQSVLEELDDVNKKIVDLISQGYKQKDIAKELGISDAAVSKRMKKIREVIVAKSNIK